MWTGNNILVKEEWPKYQIKRKKEVNEEGKQGDDKGRKEWTDF